MAYAQLSNTFTWGHLNGNGAITNKMSQLLNDGHIVTPDRVIQAMILIKTRLKTPITGKIISAIEEGEITMMHSDDLKFPHYLPFFLLVDGSATKAIVPIGNYIESKSDTGDYIVDAKKLKVALESAYIANKMYINMNGSKLRSNTLIRSGSKIYSAIITECINRKHAIKLSPDVHNALLFITSKFFITRVLGVTNLESQALNNYCLYNCKMPDIRSIEKIDALMEVDDYTDFSTLLKKLVEIPELKARIGKLTVSNFLESYINMYDAPMLLALENLPYLVYNIIAVNDGTFINNFSVMKNIVGDDGKKIYADLVVSIC